MFYDDKRHSPEVQEWVYRMMNDSEYFEKWMYTDNIDVYNSIIDECQKLYDNTTPATDHCRAKSL
jgi:hypothetical protein